VARAIKKSGATFVPEAVPDKSKRDPLVRLVHAWHLVQAYGIRVEPILEHDTLWRASFIESISGGIIIGQDDDPVEAVFLCVNRALPYFCEHKNPVSC
jgi:hypothetical protein